MLPAVIPLDAIRVAVVMFVLMMSVILAVPVVMFVLTMSVILAVPVVKPVVAERLFTTTVPDVYVNDPDDSVH